MHKLNVREPSEAFHTNLQKGLLDAMVSDGLSNSYGSIRSSSCNKGLEQAAFLAKPAFALTNPVSVLIIQHRLL